MGTDAPRQPTVGPVQRLLQFLDRVPPWCWWTLLAASGLLIVTSACVLLNGSLGNLGEWLAGLGTLAALGVSLYLIRDGQVLRRRDDVERERRQAQRVSCWVGTVTFKVSTPRGSPAGTGTAARVFVRNSSDQPIFEVVIQPEPYDPADPEAPTMVSMWGTIPPGETVDSGWPDPPDRPQRARPMVNFLDANGIAWQRDGFRLTVLSRATDKVKQVGLYKVSAPVPYRIDRAQ